MWKNQEGKGERAPTGWKSQWERAQTSSTVSKSSCNNPQLAKQSKIQNAKKTVLIPGVGSDTAPGPSYSLPWFVKQGK